MVNPTLTSTPKPSPTPPLKPTPKPTLTPKPTTISTMLKCSDIVQAIKTGGSAWSEFYESSIGAPIHFTGYVFQIDWDKDFFSVYSDECGIEMWLKGIPHSTVLYTSYTQLVNGLGTIEDYPDKVYMDEVLINVDLSTLEIH
jgi:hypothetical protein